MKGFPIQFIGYNYNHLLHPEMKNKFVYTSYQTGKDYFYNTIYQYNGSGNRRLGNRNFYF